MIINIDVSFIIGLNKNRMSEENIKYKFENLQPINFLKRFNKMVEDDEKKPVRNTRK